MTFQADPAVWINLSTTFPADYIILAHILFEIVFEILDFTHSPDEHTSCPKKTLLEVVFEILDFTYSPDEPTSCPTILRNNFVAGPL